MIGSSGVVDGGLMDVAYKAGSARRRESQGRYPSSSQGPTKSGRVYSGGNKVAARRRAKVSWPKQVGKQVQAARSEKKPDG